jgi:ACS family hexuronate transporter-like MFS transporter
MLTFALAVAPVAAVGLLVDHGPILGIATVYWAVAIVSLAAGGHQGWSCNLFTLVSDTVPKSSVAVAVGAINGFAMIGVAAFQFFVGRVVQLTSSYTWPFVAAGCLYLFSLGVIQIFMPTVEQTAPTRLAKIPYVVAGAAAFLVALLFMQILLNRPPYANLADYKRIRQTELHAFAPPVEGPAAQVGWMESHWFRWQLPSGAKTFELVKLDTEGRPVIEAKGAKASKYKGPTAAAVAADFSP